MPFLRMRNKCMAAAKVVYLLTFFDAFILTLYCTRQLLRFVNDCNKGCYCYYYYYFTCIV